MNSRRLAGIGWVFALVLFPLMDFCCSLGLESGPGVLISQLLAAGHNNSGDLVVIMAAEIMHERIGDGPSASSASALVDCCSRKF